MRKMDDFVVKFEGDGVLPSRLSDLQGMADFYRERGAIPRAVLQAVGDMLNSERASAGHWTVTQVGRSIRVQIALLKTIRRD